MAKPVEENYLITIKGTMEQNGENDTVELMTRGNFVQRGNSYYIVYAENRSHRLRRMYHHGARQPGCPAGQHDPLWQNIQPADY